MVLLSLVVGCLAVDGDSFRCLGLNLRLNCVDAPEISQPFGRASRDRLRQLTKNQTLRVTFLRVDRFQRQVVKAEVQGRDLSLDQVRSGLAYADPYCKDKEILKAQEIAKKRRIGVWSDTTLIKPWDFRRVK